MTTIKRLDRKINKFFELKMKRYNELDREIDTSRDGDRYFANFSNLLRWNMREIFILSHLLFELENLKNILDLSFDGMREYKFNEEGIQRLLNYHNKLIIDVMNEDTLNFSTSPESDMEKHARYMAKRKVWELIDIEVRVLKNNY